jgi:hypothetical protein
MIRAPLRIISIGGVMADDPGIDRVKHLFHFYGSKDPVEKLGGKLYAGRWRISQQSKWNQALREGRITMRCLGPLTHNGKANYFDWTNNLPGDQSGAEVSLAAVISVLAAEGLLSDAEHVPTTADRDAEHTASRQPELGNESAHG